MKTNERIAVYVVLGLIILGCWFKIEQKINTYSYEGEVTSDAYKYQKEMKQGRFHADKGTVELHRGQA